MKERIEKVLNISLLDEIYNSMLIDWKAFCTNPELYKDTVVVDMVIFWIKNLSD